MPGGCSWERPACRRLPFSTAAQQHRPGCSALQGGSTTEVPAQGAAGNQTLLWPPLLRAGKSPSGKLVVDIERLRPVSKVGGIAYALSGECFDLAVPAVGKK